MTPNMDPIADEETLYRCVRHDQPDRGLFFQRPDDGMLVPSSQAFSDKYKRPSVDRAKLRQHDPTRSRWSEGDGILSLVTQAVRSIDNLKRNKPVDESYTVDVEPKPEADNDAHAEIFTTPHCSNWAFKRLIERLAYLAVWEIEPRLPS